MLSYEYEPLASAPAHDYARRSDANRIVTIPDDLPATSDELWPDETWSQVLEHALALLIDASTDSHDEQPNEVQLAQSLLDDAEIHDDLKQRMAAALCPAAHR